MKYFVNIEETVNGVFEVEANSKEEAYAVARDKYNNGEFVNEPGNVSFVQASVMTDIGEFDKWGGLRVKL